MSEQKVYPVPNEIAAQAHITREDYDAMYRRSVEDPEGFWAEQAEKYLDWFKPWDKVLDWSFEGDVHIEWFKGAELNVAYNCIDRHLEKRADQTAIIWEGDAPDTDQHITYRALHENVSRLANALKARGVKKGDRVCIYMPMIPEASYAMLACARIGAIHSVVFGGFSPGALKDRIQNAGAQVVITADEGLRGGRSVPLKANADKAVVECPDVHTVLTVKHTGGDIDWHDGRDVWYHEATETTSADCPCEPMDAEDPLFILYTSGSTGTPKGVLHTTGGYLLYAMMTTRYVFDLQEGDVYWCTADVGWITGHSYMIYGPLANGTTTLLFEGVPSYPDASRFWQVVDKHQVNIFYTAPTAIRALMKEGDEPVKKASRKSLRILGTVGEPINPEAWEWYYHVVGDGRCPVVDTWWQTETGGHMITPLPGATDLKPGSATQPFFGVVPELRDAQGNVVEGEGEGGLVITRPWPGQMRTVFGDHERFKKTYFSTYPGCYFSEDGARRDADGDFWITGRMDDVLNVSGHRMGTAEIESALVAHDGVAEAAVVGFPHDVKGQGIYCFVILVNDAEPSDELKKALVAQVRSEIGPIASPDVIQWAPGLPKTRSGKIMRRILRKIAANQLDDLGDTSTLADPGVVDQLIEGRPNS
ncbi:MAG: acetate--CoA ligase [Pseudomonadota bacterium]